MLLPRWGNVNNVNSVYILIPVCLLYVKVLSQRELNGEYSGQIFLFMPQPPKSQILIFALFFKAFFVAARCRTQKCNQKSGKIMKLTR